MVNLNKTQSKESLKVYDQARAVLKHHRSKKEEIFARKLGFWVRYTKGLWLPEYVLFIFALLASLAYGKVAGLPWAARCCT